MAKSKKIALNNPAAAALIASPQGQNAAAAAIQAQTKAIDLAFTLFKYALVGTGIYLAYNAITNRFKKMDYYPQYPVSNISEGQAKGKADAIESSDGFFKNSFDVVVDQFTGVNMNGLVEIYNAFGHRKGIVFGGNLDLKEWLRDKYSTNQVTQLDFLTGGKFF